MLAVGDQTYFTHFKNTDSSLVNSEIGRSEKAIDAVIYICSRRGWYFPRNSLASAIHVQFNFLDVLIHEISWNGTQEPHKSKVKIKFPFP